MDLILFGSNELTPRLLLNKSSNMLLLEGLFRGEMESNKIHEIAKWTTMTNFIHNPLKIHLRFEELHLRSLVYITHFLRNILPTSSNEEIRIFWYFNGDYERSLGKKIEKALHRKLIYRSERKIA